MELRPGKCFETSSHFIPKPRRWMISASSAGVHLDCFFAGEADGCGLLGGGRLFTADRGAVGARGAAADADGS